jgi:methylglutaconyl-CoA hydratase
MSDPLVRIEHMRPGVVHVVLNRPEKRNALNIPLLTEFCEAVESVAQSERVIVLRGEGPVFCAGLDLKEAADTEKAHESAELVARALRAIAHAPCVTIAAVHGAAVAGGAGIMSACDIVVAAEKTSTGYPEVRRGLVAGLVMTFIKRRCNERDARELLLLGEVIDAERGRDMGLINQVVPQEALIPTIDHIVATILKGSPQAIARSKAMWAEIAPRSVDKDIQLALDYHVQARTSQDAQEGMKAFLEKRLPKWDPDA